MKNMNEANLHPITIILPAYDEEQGVGMQVEHIRKALNENGIEHEIIVVDDGSKDKTAEKALQAQARVLQHPENQGYGKALKSGITAAKYDTIVIMDADGTYPADQIPNMVASLETADMVVGARVGKDVNIPFIRRPAKFLLRWLATRIAGKDIPDLNSGMRIFRRECVEQYFSILPDRFSFTTTITLAMLGDGYYVKYLPINYNKRVGKSKITPRNFMEFMSMIFRMAVLFQPLRVFVPVAFLFILVGSLKAIFDITLLIPRITNLGYSSLLSQPILSTSSILLLLVGLQFLFIGMIADGLLRKIAQRNKPLIPSRAPNILESELVHTTKKDDESL
jgi:glycosyltransferase involved in cell wall biosynthesis